MYRVEKYATGYRDIWLLLPVITSSNDNDMRIGYNYQVPLLLARMIDEF